MADETEAHLRLLRIKTERAKRHIEELESSLRAFMATRPYEVRADGKLLTCEPASELPLAQLYFLF